MTQAFPGSYTNTGEEQMTRAAVTGVSKVLSRLRARQAEAVGHERANLNQRIDPQPCSGDGGRDGE